MADSSKVSLLSVSSPDSKFFNRSPSKGSPDSKLFSGSTSPESNSSLSDERIEVSPLSEGHKSGNIKTIPFPSFHLSPIPFFPDEHSTSESSLKIDTICVDDIECFIPNDGSEVSTILQMRVPEIKKMLLVAKEMKYLASKLCCSLRIRSKLPGGTSYSPTKEKSELVAVYIKHNTNLADYSQEVVDMANALITNFDDVLLWCVQVPEDLRIKWLDTIEERLNRQIFALRELTDNLINVLIEYRDFPYKSKISCLIVLCNEISVKMIDLRVEVRNLNYYLSRTVEIRSLKEITPRE